LYRKRLTIHKQSGSFRSKVTEVGIFPFLQEISQRIVYGSDGYGVAPAAIDVYSDFHITQVYEKPQMISAAFHRFPMYSYTDYLLFGNTWRIALYPTPTRKAVASRTDIVFCVMHSASFC